MITSRAGNSRHYENAVDGRYLRYSVDRAGHQPFGAVGGCPSNTLRDGRTECEFYGHITQSFGGYGIVTGNRVGIFGAYGQAPTMVNATCPTCQGVAGSGKPFTRIGIDEFDLQREWNVFGAIMRMAMTARNCSPARAFRLRRTRPGMGRSSNWIMRRPCSSICRTGFCLSI